MNRRIKLVTVVSIVVVLVAVLVVGTALAQGPNPTPRTPDRWRGGAGWGPSGMMGGWGPGGHMGTGMMGGWGPGGQMGTGMMGGWQAGPNSCPGMGGWGGPGAEEPITLEQAVEIAQRYVEAYGNPDLVVTEVMEFTNNFYAEVKEESTGVHAFEFLINRYTGAVHPEPGPNMMWNTKYGHMGGWGGMMGGMMGGWWGSAPGGEMTVTPEQARQYAQQFLDRSLPGTTVADEVDAFYGYYTLHVLRDGQVVGMLSVNGYTGQVWYHTWHGDFLGMWELE